MPPPIFYNFTNPSPHVQIGALLPGSCQWEAVRSKRHATNQLILQSWNLKPGAEWTAEDWRNHQDWKRLGYLHTEFVPLNALVMVGYGGEPFFYEGIRLDDKKRQTSKLAIALGQFLSDRLVALPLPQRERDGVIVKDLNGPGNQVLWLGFLLQAARLVWGDEQGN
jgi:hypothetical protein